VIKKILLSVLLLFMPTVSYADSLSNPTFAYGESLTEKEKQKTKEDLGVDNNSDEIEVRIDEMNDLLYDTYDYNQVYSSVYIKPTQEKEGVKTTIVTPNTITVKTEVQYTNAAITAGATDVDIRVSSVKPVDGSGALAGLYKAYKQNGKELNERNIKVAQEELELISKISNDKSDIEDFDDNEFNIVIADIKKQIIEVKRENYGKALDKEQIRDIVINNINNYNFNVYLSEDEINSIIDLMNDFQYVELTKDQVNELTKLGKDFLEQSKQAFKDAGKTWQNMDQYEREDTATKLSRFLEPIKEWIDKIIERNKERGLY
jgi:extracellular protein